MKKFIYVLIFPLFFLNCSFDNKTGIWKDQRDLKEVTNKKYENLKSVFVQKEAFNDEIEVDKNLK